MALNEITKVAYWNGAEGVAWVMVAGFADTLFGISPGIGWLQLLGMVYGLFKVTYAVIMFSRWS